MDVFERVMDRVKEVSLMLNRGPDERINAGAFVNVFSMEGKERTEILAMGRTYGVRIQMPDVVNIPYSLPFLDFSDTDGRSEGEWKECGTMKMNDFGEDSEKIMRFVRKTIIGSDFDKAGTYPHHVAIPLNNMMEMIKTQFQSELDRAKVRVIMRGSKGYFSKDEMLLQWRSHEHRFFNPNIDREIVANRSKGCKIDPDDLVDLAVYACKITGDDNGVLHVAPQRKFMRGALEIAFHETKIGGYFPPSDEYVANLSNYPEERRIQIPLPKEMVAKLPFDPIHFSCDKLFHLLKLFEGQDEIMMHFKDSHTPVLFTSTKEYSDQPWVEIMFGPLMPEFRGYYH